MNSINRFFFFSKMKKIFHFDLELVYESGCLGVDLHARVISSRSQELTAPFSG